MGNDRDILVAIKNRYYMGEWGKLIRDYQIRTRETNVGDLCDLLSADIEMARKYELEDLGKNSNFDNFTHDDAKRFRRVISDISNGKINLYDDEKQVILSSLKKCVSLLSDKEK